MSRAPYKYLDYYTFEDADLFFGREEETQRMVGEILSSRLLVLFSPSGSGKTSLINAGVRRQLENMGYKTIYTRLETEPISSVCNAVARSLEIPCNGNIQSLYEFLKTVTRRTEKSLVIFLDQFEEFFTIFREQHEKRKEFIDQLAKIKYDDQLPVFVVLSLREDYFVNLHEFRNAIPSIFQNNANLRLEPFTDEEARRAIVNPLRAKEIDASIEDALVNELIKDLMKDSQPGIEPIKLQIVCHTLWEKKPKGADQISLADYQACEGADAILSHHVQNLLNKIPKRQHGFMVRIFEALKTDEDTKRFRSFGELQKELKIKKPERLAKMLDKFSQLHILRYEEKEQTKWYEFKHDYLVDEITKWIQQRRERRDRNRFIYGVTPGITLFIVLFIYGLIEYNTYYARFSNFEYPQQQQEIIIQRGFNPFGEVIGTRYWMDDVKDYESKNDLLNGFKISFWNKNNWNKLAEKIKPKEAAHLFKITGESSYGIDYFLDILEDSTSHFRCEIIEALEILEQNDPRVIQAMISMLNDKELDVRFQAVRTLGKLGHIYDKEVSQEIVKGLKNADPNIRSYTAYIIGKLKIDNEEMIQALVTALKDSVTEVRGQAVAALRLIGNTNEKVIRSLIVKLRDEVWDVRFEAVNAIANLCQDNQMLIQTLLAELKDSDSSVRYLVVKALSSLTKNDKEVIQSLITSLEDEDWNVRCQAARGLGNLNQVDKYVITSLKRAMKDKIFYVRFEAAWALLRLDKVDKRVTQVLITALKKPDLKVRFQAIQALVRLDRVDKRVIKVLIAFLKNPDSNVRAQAIEVIGSLSDVDDLMIQALIDALDDESVDVRITAAGMLGLLSHTDDYIIHSLLDALKNETSYIKEQINLRQEFLTQEGILSDTILMYAQYSSVYYQFTESLVKLGKVNKRVLQLLMDTLKDAKPELFCLIAKILIKMGQADENVIKILLDTFKSNSTYERYNAILALREIDHSDRQMIQSLITALKDDNWLVRYRVAEVLGSRSLTDDLVIQLSDPLMALLNDIDRNVRNQAAKVLGELLKNKSDVYLLKFLENPLSIYIIAGAQALVRKDTITDYIWGEINRLKDKDKRPLVRLGAWEAYELIQQRLKGEQAANQFIHKADSLFQINKFWEAENQYQYAFNKLTEIIRIDSAKIARTKFQQACCTAKLKRLVPTLDHLEIAFQYDKVWQDTLRAELAQKESDWAFMKDNWYLNEVLLKKGNVKSEK